MPFLRDLWFDLCGPVDKVCNLINKWSPEDLSGEAAIEESLYAHLTNHMKGHDIRRQFPHDRVRADILINEKVAIEIKLNLTSTAEFQRLIGQLETYARWGVQMIVLIVGQIDMNLKTRLEERLLADWDDEESARLVHIAGNDIPA
ncbi:MAG TPA: hypothetical protein QF468_02825 [Nitrospinota bacterium]|nr:hypothetical protein [Nitrospinota bacterium]